MAKFTRRADFAPVSPDSLVSVGPMSTQARRKSAGGGTSLIFVAAFMTWSHTAVADDRTMAAASAASAAAASTCRPAAFATGLLGEAADARTFMLDDGRE